MRHVIKRGKRQGFNESSLASRTNYREQSPSLFPIVSLVSDVYSERQEWPFIPEPPPGFLRILTLSAPSSRDSLPHDHADLQLAFKYDLCSVWLF